MNLELDWETGSSVLTGVFVLGLFWIYLRAHRAIKAGTDESFVDYAPSLLTSLGIFGTFLGIVIGLLNFDPQHIDGSIQQLLAGLKTAFITSIAGIAASITVKWEEVNRADRRQASGNSDTTLSEVGPQEIYGVLNRQLSSMEGLQRAIGGDGERSMVGQMQMLRTEVNDFRSKNQENNKEFQKELWNRLDAYAEMMSKSATEQVIEALKQVIVEFNQRLTEQFGDNFKRLDESVKKLVDWQAQYMVQLDEMSKQYALGVTAIDATSTAVQGIRAETARIPTDMATLAEVLSVNQHQVQELGRHLDAFVKMRDKAIEAVPEIKEQLEKVGLQLHAGAEKVNAVLIQGSEQFIHSVQRTNDSMLEAGKNVAAQSEHISKELSDALELLAANTERIRTGITATVATAMESVQEGATMATASTSQAIAANSAKLDEALKASVMDLQSVRDAHANALQAMTSSVAQNTDRSLAGVEKSVQEAVKLTNEAVNGQLRQLDEALTKQLNAALQELGTALGTIANHLVETYQRRARDKELASN